MEFQVVDIDGKEFVETDIIEKNGKMYYSGLDDDNEFDLALMYFAKKHSNFLKNQE